MSTPDTAADRARLRENPPTPENPSNRVVLDVDHVSYNVGTVDSLDYNLRNCLPSHRDALLDARAYLYPNAPTEGWG